MTKKKQQQKLQNEQRSIHRKIKTHKAKINKYGTRVVDGIIDIKKYVGSKFRICFVLKEATDPYQPSLINYLKKEAKLNEVDLTNTTWNPVAYISYSVLNGFKSYDKIKENEKEKEGAKEIRESFLSIAAINVGKSVVEGDETTPYSKLKKFYEDWKLVLHEQIEAYEPNIIIFGGTGDLFKDYLGLNVETEPSNPKFYKKKGKKRIYKKFYYFDKKIYGKYYFKPGQIFLDVYHPGQPNLINKGEYIDGIINSIRKMKNKLK